MSPSRVKRRASASDWKVLEAIQDWYGDHDYAPSIREVGEMVGITTQSTHAHIIWLEKFGYVKRAPFTSRSVTLTKKARRELEEWRQPKVEA